VVTSQFITFKVYAHFDMLIYNFHVGICPPKVFIFTLHIMFYEIIQYCLMRATTKRVHIILELDERGREQYRLQK